MLKSEFWFICLLVFVSPRLDDLEYNVATILASIFVIANLFIEWYKND